MNDENSPKTDTLQSGVLMSSPRQSSEALITYAVQSRRWWVSKWKDERIVVPASLKSTSIDSKMMGETAKVLRSEKNWAWILSPLLTS